MSESCTISKFDSLFNFRFRQLLGIRHVLSFKQSKANVCFKLMALLILLDVGKVFHTSGWLINHQAVLPR